MNAEQALNQSLNTIDSIPARLLATRLSRIHYGELRVSLPNGEDLQFTGPANGQAGNIAIRNPASMLRRALVHGSIGFAEAFMAGDWTSKDLPRTLEVLLVNKPFIGYRKQGNLLQIFRDNLQHFSRRNSVKQSKSNINYHYDLGNDFYELWLDESFSYSSALFESESESLEDAQKRKYARILNSLESKPGEHLLEIGCGWGSLAIEAAKRGLDVTAITLSEEQLKLAQQRIHSEGLTDKARVRLCDYRNIKGKFDHIVSVEMFEAVGEQYWPGFFQTLANHLSNRGRAALQVITIQDHLFRYYRRTTDFIQKYIFPGGMLPSPQRFMEAAECAGLELIEKSFFGSNYALTLAAWSSRFLESLPAARKLGYDDEFLRMWHYYLAYCETGFRTGQTDLMQITLRQGD